MTDEQVLLIDDEAVVREIGGEMLDALGIGCIKAENGEEGIRLYQKNRSAVGLVILDIEMPGISGDKVYETLKEINPNLKILLTSGYARNYLEAKYFKQKLDETYFLPKPFQMEQFTRKVKFLIEP
jgi:CheY-like chemotaxis protein